MRFSLTDVLEAAERLVRGPLNHDELAAAQQRAAREDSIPRLMRDMIVETLRSLLRRSRPKLPPS